MLNTIIFDLDDTLFPSSELSKKARIHACESMIREGLPAKSTEECYERLQRIVKEFGSNDPDHFSKLCESYGIPPKPKIIANGVVAYHSIKISQLAAYPTVEDTLMRLHKEGYTIALITAGLPVKQWEKIVRLGLRPYFTHIHVVDGPDPDNKKKAFEEMIVRCGSTPGETLVVGDRVDREIRFANELGCHTLRILQGKRKDDVPATKDEEPDFTSNDITEVETVITKIKEKR